METTSLFISDVANKYSQIKVGKLYGRYITAEHIEPILERLKSSLKIREIGKSTLEASIKIVEFGKGAKKILAWSQMHGNESTTTKAVFDLLNFFLPFLMIRRLKL
ncbi:hypothetical protein LZ575_03750 [Antarcticibacterium sp. 1MA-6-2]|uniref:hypothetical protein n=1 Tax=Antarcticibacterium sp. 1MA-6-2 TaxID=2908210 RepID=UPI001F255390|nr:hypothetical protein [Antarcticibacterium sp. 1MA-6-2]UJH91794.1 hypothetical protein LZ575_03750 [Antarcticibacterium sp. 1MA-6-2]